jgi:DNA uptake protein ComE-like DNA-binding protein
MMNRALKTVLLALVMTAAAVAPAQDPAQDQRLTPKKSTETAAKAKARAARIKAKEKAKAEADAKRIDLNTASKEQLKTVPGITDAYADKIIAGRPYLTKAHLVTNGALPEGVYLAIRDRVAVRRPAAKR